MSADHRALISRLLKVLKVMQSAHERQVHMGIWEADISAIEDAIVALSSPDRTSIMQAADKAAKVVEGWSDAKREYAERVTGPVSSPDRSKD